MTNFRLGFCEPGSLPAKTHSEKGDDWPRFLGTTFDGKSTESGIRIDWSNGQLKPLWSKPLGTSYGIGSVADGKYLQFDRNADAEQLFCLDAKTGQLIWTSHQAVEYKDLYGYSNGPRSSPTIEEGLVYTLGVSGRLACRQLTDGKTTWTVDTNKHYGVVQNFFGVGCSPLVWKDLVIVMVGGSPAADQNVGLGRIDRVSPNGSAVVAFDRISGVQRWKVGNQLASYGSPRMAMIDEKPTVLVLTRGGLMAIDPNNGTERWFFPWRAKRLESVNAAMPLVSGKYVLVSEAYEIGSALLNVSKNRFLTLRTDPPNRRKQSFRAHWATPIEVDGYVYGCSGRNEPDSDLRCIDLETGEIQWVDPRRTRSSLLYVDRHFVVLNERGTMQLIQANPKQFKVVTSIDLSRATPLRPALQSPLWAAPILSHGLLYVRGSNAVICFELIPGR